MGPHPLSILRRAGRLEDAADDDAIFEHAVVFKVWQTGGAGCFFLPLGGGALMSGVRRGFDSDTGEFCRDVASF
jgi:hypothetical protein